MTDDGFEDEDFDEADEAGESDEGASGEGIGLCMVLLRERTVDWEKLNAHLQSVFGGEVEAINSDPLSGCLCADGTLFLLHMPGPVPNQEAEEAANYYYFWEDGAAEVAQHKSHVIVTATGEGDVVDRILLATRGARAVLQAAESVGVYWGNGSIANSTETFLQMSEEADRDSLPLYLWVRFQLMPGETEDRVGLYTLGLSQFGEQEIEVVNTSWKVGPMMEFLYNVAHYILTSGNTIEDGNTIGGDENQKITVSYEPSVLDAERTVYRIDLP